MKRRVISFIVLIFILISNTNIVTADIIYYDVYDHWAANEIYWATNDVMIFNGYDDWTFRPENSITRAEYIAILYRTAKLQNIITPNFINETKESLSTNTDGSNTKKENTLGYIDVDEASWAKDAIRVVGKYVNSLDEKIKFQDIFPGDKFYPNQPITREEAAVVTSFFTSPPIDMNNMVLTDIDSEYRYFESINKLVSNGIITGYEDKTFKPDRNITRAESATIIKRLYFDMEYLKGKYLQDIQLISDGDDEKYTLFGKYNYDELTKEDIMYIKAKNTLEYIAFGGYIFPEDEHLYDPDPLETLKKLKESKYNNIIGLNYYLIKFGDLTEEDKQQLLEEMIEDYLKREDIDDYEATQIFKECVEYNIDINKIFEGLDKWDEATDDVKVKANIRFLRYKAYLKNNRIDELLNLVTQEIESENNKVTVLVDESENKVEISTEQDNSVEGNLDENTEVINETNEENEQIDEENIKEDETVINSEETGNNADNDSLDPDSSTTTEDSQTSENEDVNTQSSQEAANESIVTSDKSELVMDELEIRVKTVLNRAFIMLYANRFDDAIEILRQGWEEIKTNPLYEVYKDKYDKEFIGSLKEVMIREEIYDNLPNKDESTEE